MRALRSAQVGRPDRELSRRTLTSGASGPGARRRPVMRRAGAQTLSSRRRAVLCTARNGAAYSLSYGFPYGCAVVARKYGPVQGRRGRARPGARPWHYGVGDGSLRVGFRPITVIVRDATGTSDAALRSSSVELRSRVGRTGKPGRIRNRTGRLLLRTGPTAVSSPVLRPESDRARPEGMPRRASAGAGGPVVRPATGGGGSRPVAGRTRGPATLGAGARSGLEQCSDPLGVRPSTVLGPVSRSAAYVRACDRSVADRFGRSRAYRSVGGDVAAGGRHEPRDAGAHPAGALARPWGIPVGEASR